MDRARCLPLACVALAAAPIACHAPPRAPKLNVAAEGSTTFVLAQSADGSFPRAVGDAQPAEGAVVPPSSDPADDVPAPRGFGLDPTEPEVSFRAPPVDSEALGRYAGSLVPNTEPAPTPHPFTGPWQPLSPGFLSPFLEQPEDRDQDAKDSGSGHWSGLPLMSDLARENNIKLPEPFGLTATYFVINRPSRVTKVKAGINNQGLRELPSLAFEANAKVQSAIGRLDAWILPMLDVYLLGGYVWNDSSVDMVLDLPGNPNTAFRADGHLEGPVVGAGTTLAGGYGNYFLIADFNWNTVMLGGLDEMDARLLTARVGYRMQSVSWADEVRFYLATTYWDTARTISGSIPFNSGSITSIQYAVDQEPVDPWTIGGGTNIQFSKNWGFTTEVQGYSKTIYVVGALNFRF